MSASVKKFVTTALVSVGVILMGVGAWAVVGPDSIWQNYLGARSAAGIDDCKLYPIKPGDGDWALINVAGWQKNEPVTAETNQKCFGPALINFQTTDQTSGIDIWKDVTVYSFEYDTSQAPDVVGAKLHRLMEGDPFLTKPKTRHIFLCHSFGGLVATGAQLAGGGRKSLGSLNAGVPWQGTPMADPKLVMQAGEEIYLGVGELLLSNMLKRVDFTSPSVQWLKPDSQLRTTMLSRADFSHKFLYVGECLPAGSDIVSRNLGLAGLFEAWAWENSSVGNHVAYSMGANFIHTLGYGASDGIVPQSSAMAEDYALTSQVRLVGRRNHSEVITGNQGDEWLHRQMYQDLVSLLPVTKKEAPNFGEFDIWVPEVPVFDLPSGWREAVSENSLVFTRNQVLMIAKEDGTGETVVSTGQLKASWPKWLGKALLFTGSINGHSDIYLMNDKHKGVRLTNDGQSQWAVPIGEGLNFVMQSGGKLVLGSAGGLRRVLVDAQLQLDSPPLVVADKVYFTHRNTAGSYDLYWVALSAHNYRLDQAKLVATTVRRPIYFSGCLLVIDTSREHWSITVLTKAWVQQVAMTAKYLNHYDSSKLETVIGVDDLSRVYLVFDGQIRLMEQATVVGVLADSWQWAAESGVITLPNLNDLAPVVATGVELDVR